MRIRIGYMVPTSGGQSRQHEIIAESFEEAEEICEKCDELSYIIVDVTNEPELDGETNRRRERK